jgi:hypothetical protein
MRRSATTQGDRAARAGGRQQSGGGYAVPPEPPPAAAPAQLRPAQPPIWAPASGASQPTKGRARAQTVLPTAPLEFEVAPEEPELPGPFFDVATLLYPWLHPTWICWLGLSFMTALAAAAIFCTMFFFVIIMSFGAFVSLFTFAAMVTVCLGLASYIATTFVWVVEQSANGDNRLQRLPGYVWYEILPPAFRTAGAAAGAIGLAVGTTYLLRQWLGEWYAPQVLLLDMVLVFLLFPITMISNSVAQSFLPIYSLFPTLFRLVKCCGHFLLFLFMAGLGAAGVTLGLIVLFALHVAAGLVAAGPVVAAWVMFYGHWLGRLARQLSAAD